MQEVKGGFLFLVQKIFIFIFQICHTPVAWTKKESSTFY